MFYSLSSATNCVYPVFPDDFAWSHTHQERCDHSQTPQTAASGAFGVSVSDFKML